MPSWINFSTTTTAIMAIAAVWGVVLAIRQLRAQQHPVDRSSDLLEKANRASLVVSEVIVGNHSFKLKILNGGRTPAINVTVLVRGELGRRNTVPEFSKCEREYRGVVAPGAEWLVEFPPEPPVWKFDPVAYAMYPTMHKPGDPDTVLVFGIITYGDHFDPHRKARFSYQLKRMTQEFEPGAGNDYP